MNEIITILGIFLYSYRLTSSYDGCSCINQLNPCKFRCITWRRHQMETRSALLVICAGNSPVPGEFTAQWPVTRSFDVFFDLHPNKPPSKQSWGWWLETPSRPLWRYCNENDHQYRLVEGISWVSVTSMIWWSHATETLSALLITVTS